MSEDLERQREHFNSIAEQYYRARTNKNHLLLKDLIWRSFFDRNKEVSGQVNSVLEPMCGMAEGYEILKQNLGVDFAYQGFDYSENMVEIARAAKAGLQIDWGDVTAFSPPDTPVDLIILIGGLHHVYSRCAQVIANLSNAVRPGGYFISLEPTHNNLLNRAVRERIYKSNNLFDDDTEQGFEYYDLSSNFEKAGFERIDEVYPGLLSYILYYNPDAFPILNIGGLTLVRILFQLDRLFWANWIGRKMSFATLTLWRRL